MRQSRPGGLRSRASGGRGADEGDATCTSAKPRSSRRYGPEAYRPGPTGSTGNCQSLSMWTETPGCWRPSTSTRSTCHPWPRHPTPNEPYPPYLTQGHTSPPSRTGTALIEWKPASMARGCLPHGRSLRVGQRMGPGGRRECGGRARGCARWSKFSLYVVCPSHPPFAGGTPFLSRDGAVPRPEDRPVRPRPADPHPISDKGDTTWHGEP